MANTKKPMSKQVEKEELLTDAQATSKETKNTEVTKTTKTYSPTDTVWTTSVTAGELGMIGKKTKTLYTWSNYGDRTEIEYQDLVAARSSKSNYLFGPRFIIEDEELLDSKGWETVKASYQNLRSIAEIDAIFDLNIGAFNRAIQNLPAGLVGTVKAIAAEKIENRSLDSISKIEILDRELGTDFKLYIANN